MKVIVNFLNLSEVFVLHFSSGLALLAVFARVWEENLVNDDVLNVDLLFSKLDCKPLRLIHGQELRDAHGHEGRLLRVLELLVNFFYFGLHLIKSFEELILDFLRIHL